MRFFRILLSAMPIENKKSRKGPPFNGLYSLIKRLGSLKRIFSQNYMTETRITKAAREQRICREIVSRTAAFRGPAELSI